MTTFAFLPCSPAGLAALPVKAGTEDRLRRALVAAGHFLVLGVGIALCLFLPFLCIRRADTKPQPIG